MEADLTGRIKEILDTPDREVDIAAAALLLLKMNRNRILYESICRRKNTDKLKYELRKMYDFHTTADAAKKTRALEQRAAETVRTTFPKEEKREASATKGLRPDHEQLPDKIRAKYLENLNIYPKMRKLHEQLKLMNTALPCDRYPFLKELKELDDRLRKNWDEYDNFSAAPAGAAVATPSPVVLNTKKISAARKYLSDNKATLSELKAQADQSKYLNLLSKMQERLALIISSGAGISEGQLSELKALGLEA
jgi:hypothetical protein